MDKNYGPAHWYLITSRQRLSLSTMSGDKDSGLVFPFLSEYTESLSLKCGTVEKQKNSPKLLEQCCNMVEKHVGHY